MQHLNHHDRDFVAHTAEVMADRLGETEGYNHLDEKACLKLEAIGKGGTALVLTGAELDERGARGLMAMVVEAELAHWVPGSSRRLIWRAAQALGFHVPDVLNSPFIPTECGAERRWHSLTPVWIAGSYLMCCPTCGRLYT